MKTINRYRDESIAFVASLGVHVLLLVQIGFWTNGSATSRTAALAERATAVAVISIVPLTLPPGLGVQTPASAAPMNGPAATARVLPPGRIEVAAPRAHAALDRRDAALPERAPDAFVGEGADPSPPDQAEIEERARLIALQTARDVNAARIREHESRAGGASDPRE